MTFGVKNMPEMMRNIEADGEHPVQPPSKASSTVPFPTALRNRRALQVCFTSLDCQIGGCCDAPSLGLELARPATAQRQCHLSQERELRGQIGVQGSPFDSRPHGSWWG